MLDRNGKAVRVGDAVLMRTGKGWTPGTVRQIRPAAHRPGSKEALVDDGIPEIQDPRKNKFRYASWLDSEEVQIP